MRLACVVYGSTVLRCQYLFSSPNEAIPVTMGMKRAATYLGIGATRLISALRRARKAVKPVAAPIPAPPPVKAALERSPWPLPAGSPETWGCLTWMSGRAMDAWEG